MPTVERGTDQITVLNAVLERLVSQVSLFTADNVSLSIEPEPGVEVSQGIYATVSPDEGQFEQDILEGAGAADCREYTGVIITVFNAKKLDRRDGVVKSLLLDEVAGLLALKRSILRAFTGHELLWQDVKILAEPMFPLRSSKPDKKERAGDLSLTFTTTFRWEL